MKIKKKKYFPLLFFLIFGGERSIFLTQEEASVGLDIVVNAPLSFGIEGTDADYIFSANETCNMGYVDATGTPTSGSDPDNLGIMGYPVDAGGNSVPNFLAANCVGSFYQFMKMTGTSPFPQHQHYALFIDANGPINGYRLYAQYQASTFQANVTREQVVWKWDETPSGNDMLAYDTFNPPGTPVVVIYSGKTRFLHMDLGLVIHKNDGAGLNTWNLLFTAISMDI